MLTFRTPLGLHIKDMLSTTVSLAYGCYGSSLQKITGYWIPNEKMFSFQEVSKVVRAVTSMAKWFFLVITKALQRNL